LLALGWCARFGLLVRAIGAVLAVVLLVAGCAAGSGQASGSGGGADPAGSGSPTAASGCGRDEVMSRPCPDGAPKADQIHRPRYKSDLGAGVAQDDDGEHYGGSHEYCRQRLKDSFQAFKACVRY
jgi:hypothetical protein